MVFGLHPFFVEGRATLRPFFEFAPFVSTLLAPALAMRSLAEEQRTGQLDLLRSWPLPTAALVVGKFVGALVQIAPPLAGDAVSRPDALIRWLAVAGIALTAINMFGGFAVTRRMLAMFRK